MLKQSLKLKLSQKLSPQQIQLMKLIQLPVLDFEQKLKQEIEENPALEVNESISFNDSELALLSPHKSIVVTFEFL